MTTPVAQPEARFTRKESVDKPGIVGAQWWQDSIASQIPRRKAMTGLLALGGILAAAAAVGTCVVAATGSSKPATPPDLGYQPRGALEMQKEFGWSFGATSEKLVFDGIATQPFDRSALDTIAEDLAPADARYAPYFVPTLFQSPAALPKSKPTGDPDAVAEFTPLKDAIVPVSLPAMTTAFLAGKSLASLFENDARAKDVAVVVDLVGPEAVAFAAGAAGVFDPVFLFDNWPHPRGVVPAHMTLAAAAYYQPLFKKARAARAKGARPMFVLDRKRLASYADDATQFDNRHTARLPGAANLAALGTKNLVYVAPNAIDRQELDDLVDDFLAYKEKVQIRTLPLTAFSASEGSAAKPDAGAFFYQGLSGSHRDNFWKDWAGFDVHGNEIGIYNPAPRATPFSAGTPAGPGARPRPTGFGTVPVAIAIGTGIVLGAKASRSGSWNRTTSTSSAS